MTGGALAPRWATLVRADNPGPMTLSGTNTWVLRVPGGKACTVVDPGPLLVEHLDAVAGRGPVAQILLTHRHDDHAEGAAWLAQRTGAPVSAADPAYVLGGRRLRDGDRIEAAGLSIRVLATPGHTSDSVCFAVEDEAEPGVLSGDTILGSGSTVVAHPDGVLSDYLASLRRLQGFGAVCMLPGHGPVCADLFARASNYLRHRERRLGQVRRALADGAATVDDVVAVVYADVDPAVREAAARSVAAQLDYLAARPEGG